MILLKNYGSCVLKVVPAKYRRILSADMSTDMSIDARLILGRLIGRGSIECWSSVDRHIGCVLLSIGGLSVNNSYFEH